MIWGDGTKWGTGTTWGITAYPTTTVNATVSYSSETANTVTFTREI
jgi:hypothetical protein